jgi:hypothetical protein
MSSYPFSPLNFFYSGLLAGGIAGELRRRAVMRQGGIALSADQLKLNFYVAALMTWAVILKVFEWTDLYGLFPGREAFGIHFAMFLPVVFWTPLVCNFLWRYKPTYAFYSIAWACVVGVVTPVVVSFILGYPSIFLFYFGVPLAYYIPWGARFADTTGLWRPVLLLFPGVTWGIIVGWVRWRYLQRGGPVVGRLAQPLSRV